MEGTTVGSSRLPVTEGLPQKKSSTSPKKQWFRSDSDEDTANPHSPPFQKKHENDNNNNASSLSNI